MFPLVNLGDRKDEFLSDGLTEEIIDSLRRVPGLQVVARTSVFRYKGKNPDIREIGQALHAGTVLVGSVLASENRVHVTVQLNSAANDYHCGPGVTIATWTTLEQFPRRLPARSPTSWVWRWRRMAATRFDRGITESRRS